MQKRFLLGLGGILAITAVLVLVLTQVRSVRSGPGARTATSSGPVTPDNSALESLSTSLAATDYAPTDLAPEVASRDKVMIFIRHENGKLDTYLLSTDMVDAFIDQLPAGDRVENLIPPESLVGHEPPRETPEP